MNPLNKAKGEARGIMAFVKAHPIGALAFGMVFGAFAFGFVATQLGKLKARGGVWDKVIPGAFTRV